MKFEKNDTIYLLHISDALSKIEQYVQGVDEKKFLKTSLIHDAVIRQLEIVGEAVKNLSTEIRDADSSIPWKDIAGMRDKLIHHYFGVDIQAVWTTATEDVPQLREEIQAILDK